MYYIFLCYNNHNIQAIYNNINPLMILILVTYLTYMFFRYITLCLVYLLLPFPFFTFLIFISSFFFLPHLSSLQLQTNPMPHIFSFPFCITLFFPSCIFYFISWCLYFTKYFSRYYSIHTFPTCNFIYHSLFT